MGSTFFLATPKNLAGKTANFADCHDLEARNVEMAKHIDKQNTTINKAKTAVSVAVEAKPEVEIWRRPKKVNFLTLVSYSLLQTVLARTYRFATIQNVTDRRQTTDRQTVICLSVVCRDRTKLKQVAIWLNAVVVATTTSPPCRDDSNVFAMWCPYMYLDYRP